MLAEIINGGIFGLLQGLLCMGLIGFGYWWICNGSAYSYRPSKTRKRRR